MFLISVKSQNSIKSSLVDWFCENKPSLWLS